MAKSTYSGVTDAKIKEQIQQGVKSIALGDGLRLVRLPSGSYVYQYNYRSGGKQKTLSYKGCYPNLPVNVARERHNRARTELFNGEDPMLLRKEKKEAAKAEIILAENTFEKIAKLWLDRIEDIVVEKTHRSTRRSLEMHAYPVFGKRPITTITALDISTLLLKIESEGKGELANRLLQRIGRVFIHAIALGIVENNPAAAIKGVLKPVLKRGFPCIKNNELAQLIRDIDGYNGKNGGDVTKYAMQFMLLLFSRTSEMIKANWNEFDDDLEVWTIPASRMKLSLLKKQDEENAHVIPLPKQATEILKKLRQQNQKSSYVFPSPFNNNKHISENTILFALYRLGYYKRMTGHSFRKLASTILNEFGWDADAIEKQLAHTDHNHIRQVYNKAQYVDRRREMLQFWADYIDLLRNGGDSKIIPLRQCA